MFQQTIENTTIAIKCLIVKWILSYYPEWLERHGFIVDDPEDADLFLPLVYHYHAFADYVTGESFIPTAACLGLMCVTSHVSCERHWGE
jgi:hypothetical protein